MLGVGWRSGFTRAAPLFHYWCSGAGGTQPPFFCLPLVGQWSLTPLAHRSTAPAPSLLQGRRPGGLRARAGGARAAAGPRGAGAGGRTSSSGDR